MNGHDGSTMFRDGVRSLLGSNECIGTDIGEHRTRTKVGTHFTARRECVGRDDDLITPSDPERLQGKMQRGRAAVKSQRMPDS